MSTSGSYQNNIYIYFSLIWSLISYHVLPLRHMKPALSAAFYIHELLDAHDSLVLL